MFAEYFGSYLVNQKMISEGQLKELLDGTSAKHKKIGELAVKAGYMAEQDAENLHAEQLNVNKKLGELAVEKNFLSQSQLSALLKKQEKPGCVFCRTLIEKNILSDAQLKHLLENYRLECRLSGHIFKSFKNDDISSLVNNLINFKNPIMKNATNRYLKFFITNVNRFVDSNASFGNLCCTSRMDCRLVSECIDAGRYKIITGFSSSDCSMEYFASKFIKNSKRGQCVTAEDAVSDFIGLSNRDFVSGLIENGSNSLALSEKFGGPVCEVCFILPFQIMFDKFELYISYQAG